MVYYKYNEQQTRFSKKKFGRVLKRIHDISDISKSFNIECSKNFVYDVGTSKACRLVSNCAFPAHWLSQIAN